MLRINLLPREVLEKRRYEKWYRWVFIGFGGAILIVLFVYAYLLLTAQSKAGDLQQLNEQKAKYQTQADAFGVFEKKEQDLAAREKIVQAALANRVNLGQVANEVSLVLPDEVWLTTLSISETEGLNMTANTPQTFGQSMDVGYKSAAKTLVRLNELPDLADVWLTSAANSTFGSYATSAGSAGAGTVTTVVFATTAKLVKPAAAVSATSSVPAPPSTGTK